MDGGVWRSNTVVRNDAPLDRNTVGDGRGRLTQTVSFI